MKNKLMAIIKNRTIVTSIILILLTAIPVIIYTDIRLPNFMQSNNIERELPERLIPTEIIDYAGTLGFQIRVVIDGEESITAWTINARAFTDPRSEAFNPFYTDFILVHNKEQALEFPDNVITAWHDYPEGIVRGINFLIRNNRPVNHQFGSHRYVALEDFGLAYPLTVDDLIYNWESVDRLFFRFCGTTQNAIRNAAPRGGLNRPVGGH